MAQHLTLPQALENMVLAYEKEQAESAQVLTLLDRWGIMVDEIKGRLGR